MFSERAGSRTRASARIVGGKDQSGNKVRYNKTLLSDWELFYDVILRTEISGSQGRCPADLWVMSERGHIGESTFATADGQHTVGE